MLRYLLLWAVMALLLIFVGLPGLLFLKLTELLAPGKKDRAAMRIAQFFLWVLGRIAGIRLTVLGLEKLPQDRNLFYVSNHRSYFDIVATYPLLKTPCGQLAKKEFGSIPLFSHWMKMIHCVFVDRSSPRAALRSSDEVAELLKKGYSFWNCPEGTRNHAAKMLPFHEGTFRPAFRTGTPIVPVTITHADDIYELHKPFVRPACITVDFGAPILTSGLSRAEEKALVAQVAAQIQKRYDELV